MRLLGKSILLFLLALLPVAALQAQTTKPIVNDITQLNPIVVRSIVTPHSTEEVSEIVKQHSGPISIGGGQFSMGGQTATDNALFIDMRQMNQILALDPAKKLVTVQAGATWQDVQKAIDPVNLSIKVMQTYHNFTVGGSMSVNSHGRYIGNGPLISTIHSFKIVLADGSVVMASPTEHSDLFYGAIGGYGGLGVITEVTLELADNVKVKRNVAVMPISQYKQYFFDHIRNSKDVIFHNADIYPPAYDTVSAVSWNKTDEPLTNPDRLRPVAQSYAADRFFFNWISEWPLGFWVRQHILDPYLYKDSAVLWRNNEAGYDVKELEPASRKKSTYVLEEYFVPVERFDEFLPKMRDVLNRHHVDMVNISIRHAEKDPGAVMAWARSEVFCFVMYYKQGTSTEAREEVGAWTRDMTDAVLSVGGSYYLPYQPHATQEQFHQAFPNADKFFALKAKYDPQYKFRNKLWDKYYTTDSLERALRQKAETTKGYYRTEDQTYLTIPEWFIVFSSDEYAEALTHRPSQFPYWKSIKQFWSIYDQICAVTESTYPPNPGYHLMIKVIGVSYSAELGLKGLYENSIGRLTEWISDRGELKPTMKVETFMQTVNRDYVKFIKVRPWYEYAFLPRFKELWQIQEDPSTNKIRSMERRLFFSGELLFKSGYSSLIEYATKQAYDEALPTTWVKIEKDGKRELRELPRYQQFTDTATALAKQGWTFVDIAGNKKILVTIIAPREWAYKGEGEVFYEWPILTQPQNKRVAVVIPVDEFADFLKTSTNGTFTVDHIFDY
jgi:FAD/FMN-containing dehydrogenase